VRARSALPPQYAQSDGLRDLTLESVRDLGNEEWLPGLAEPGRINGSQYGIPWYAANRVVIYNKDLFADAGIKSPPKTRAQWLEDCEKLNRNGVQGIYLSGQDWYSLGFPVPGRTAARPGAVFTGGSDLIVPENARERDAAIEVIKALAGERWQTDLARTMNYVPNKTSLAGVIEGEESTAAMAAGAAQGRATPNSPQWADVEADNPIKPYMTAVLQGQDPARAARIASERVTKALAAH
jgi:ABC-type glycerol-3-phosphate transport system substrate-binding protein